MEYVGSHVSGGDMRADMMAFVIMPLSRYIVVDGVSLMRIRLFR